MGRAVEQSEPDATFQLFDQYAQPGWRHEERFGSAREISMLGHEAERPQLPGTAGSARDVKACRIQRRGGEGQSRGLRFATQGRGWPSRKGGPRGRGGRQLRGPAGNSNSGVAGAPSHQVVMIVRYASRFSTGAAREKANTLRRTSGRGVYCDARVLFLA